MSPLSVVFTPLNWAAPQIVTVAGADDAIADGTVAYLVRTIAAVSDDAQYAGLDASDVSVSNIDNETAGFTISPLTGLTTTELGASSTFSVRLNTEPTRDVIVDVSSTDSSEGTASPASLTFGTSNWNTDQLVTVTGVDDAIAGRGPPPLERADTTSVTVLDREGRLLRAFTAAGGRWLLPASADEVDPRYLRMLLAYEDKRFHRHPALRLDGDAIARRENDIVLNSLLRHPQMRLDATNRALVNAIQRKNSPNFKIADFICQLRYHIISPIQNTMSSDEAYLFTLRIMTINHF